jgi:hypothetical protein
VNLAAAGDDKYLEGSQGVTTVTRFGVLIAGCVVLALLAGAAHFSRLHTPSAWVAAEAPEAATASHVPFITTRSDRRDDTKVESGTSGRQASTETTCQGDRLQACDR